MNCHDAVARILKIEGVKWMACFPDNKLIEAVSRAGIRPIVFRQERGAAMAADGFSRMRAAQGEYGVFACQHGPGTENAFGGIAQAWGEGVPILFMPDAYALERLDVDPYVSSFDTYKPITKLALLVNRPDRLAAQMRRAFVALKNGAPGPVLVEMPRLLMDADAGGAIDKYRPAPRNLTAPTRSDVKDAVAKLLAAKNPILWVGQGVHYAEAWDLLKQFAELTQTPVITTMPGKSAFDERHPLSLGATNKTAPKAVWKWLRESDLLFAVGSSLTKTTYGIDIPDGKFMIQNTVKVADIGKEYHIDIGLPGDAKLALELIVDEVKAQVGESGRKPNSKLQSDIAAVKAEWLAEWAPLLNSDARPMNPYRLVNEINQHIDHENTIFTHDAGHPRDQVMPFYTATVPHSYVGWGKTTHLGFGIPLMMGAKIAHPEKHCVNFMGDAAFGMSGLDIETTVRAGAPITTILLNNGTMGGYDQRMPEAMEVFDAGNMTGDYAKVAEGLGATGIYISDPAEIGPALTKARRINQDEGKSVLLDVKTQPELKGSVY